MMNICSEYRLPLESIKRHAIGRERCHSGPSQETSFRVPGLARDIRVKIATELEEFEAAFRLVTSNYRARGYEAPGDRPYRFTHHHVLPDSVTMVAAHDGRVVATLSLVPDTALLGLPLEHVYGPEIDRFRRRGRRMAEAICLADAGLSIREFVRVFKALIKLAMQYHRSLGGDSWVIVIHPRHRGFYQRVLGFVPMGPQRPYPSVQNHPGEAYRLDMELMAANAPEMYREVFGKDLPPGVLAAHRWSASRVRYFARRSSHLDEPTLEYLLEAIDRFEGAPRWA
jgi:hypothetical protein